MFGQIPLFMVLLKFSKGKSKSKNFLAKEFVKFKSKKLQNNSVDDSYSDLLVFAVNVKF